MDPVRGRHQEGKGTGVTPQHNCITRSCDYNVNVCHVQLLAIAADSPPANIKATSISPTEILVTWDSVPSIDRNGIITMYEVLY